MIYDKLGRVLSPEDEVIIHGVIKYVWPDNPSGLTVGIQVEKAEIGHTLLTLAGVQCERVSTPMESAAAGMEAVAAESKVMAEEGQAASKQMAK